MQSETAYGFHLSITKIPQVIKEINVTDNNLRGRWRIVITVYWIRPQIFYFTIGQPAFDIFALWKDINQCNALSSFFKNHNNFVYMHMYCRNVVTNEVSTKKNKSLPLFMYLINVRYDSLVHAFSKYWKHETCLVKLFGNKEGSLFVSHEICFASCNTLSECFMMVSTNHIWSRVENIITYYKLYWMIPRYIFGNISILRTAPKYK